MGTPETSDADRLYLTARAEEELRLSRHAASKAAAEAHSRLASAYRARASQNTAIRMDPTAHQPFGCDRGAVTCLGAKPADYQKWEGLIVTLARLGPPSPDIGESAEHRR